MAVHHILESDLENQPHYKTFKLPDTTTYIIGHNIDYDIAAIARCGVDVSHIKPICTLALARKTWPDAEAHNISALIYMISQGSSKARELLKRRAPCRCGYYFNCQYLDAYCLSFKYS